MVAFGLTALVIASALARGLAPTATPVRAEPPTRAESNERVRFPEPPPVPRGKRTMDPAALHARMQSPRSADLRNPFEIVPSKRPSFGPPPDLKDPFERRAPPPTAMVAMPISPDLRYPFPKARKAGKATKADQPAKAPRRNERATPPPPPPAPCVTDDGVPVQRPRAVRSAAPPCPPSDRAASPRTRK